MKNVRLLLIVLFVSTWASKSYGQWAPSNGPFGGSVMCLATSGANIFAGGGFGVYLSTNDGATWSNVSSSLANYSVTALAAVPNGNGGVNIFAGTYGGGIFSSANNGASWKQINSGLTSSKVSSIAVMGVNIFAGTIDGIFLSTIYGQSWSPVDSGIGDADVLSLAVSGSSVFAGTGYGYAVYCSNDTGKSWAPIDSELASAVYSSGLAAYSSGTNNTEVIVGDGASGLGIFHYTNNGQGWIRMGTTLKGTWIHSLTAIPNKFGGVELFAGTGGDGVFRSTDDGVSWVKVGVGLTETTVLALAFYTDLTGSLNLFAGTHASGVYISTDEGTKWTQTNEGFHSPDVNTIALSGASLYAGTNTGVFLSADNGNLWTQIYTGGVHSLTASPNGSGGTNLFVATDLGLFRSTDDGASWKGAITLTGFPFLSLCTYLDQSGDTAIFVGCDGGGVYRSTDQGATWAKVNTGLTDGHIYVLGQSGTNLYAGTFFGPFVSTDMGDNWTAINTGLPGVGIYSFAAEGTHLFLGTLQGVFVSANNGSSWSHADTGLSDPRVYALAAFGTDLFAGTAAGVFVSTDNGAYWTSTNSGSMGAYAVHALAISDKNLFAGTYYGVGIWKRPLSEMVTFVGNAGTHGPVTFSLGQNFPNPFNPSTIITYQLAKNEYVVLRVFDMLGRKVATLVDGRQAAGDHSVTFNAGNLPSDVYLYRLVAGAFHATGKLLLLR